MPFDPETDYERYVDGKPRADGVRDFLASRGITLPEGPPDDPPGADTVAGLGDRKNAELLQRDRATTASRSFDGSRALPGGGRGGRPAPRGRVVQREHRAGPGGRPGSHRPVRGPGRRRHAGGAHLPGQAGPRTRSWTGARQLGVAPARRPCSRTRSPAWPPAGPGASAASSASTGSAQADALRAHGADVVVADLAELLRTQPRDPAAALPGRAVVAARDQRSTWTSWRRRSRCSRCRTATSACAATSTRASRTASPARTSTASTSSARCRTPRPGTATRRRGRPSSTSPTAS